MKFFAAALMAITASAAPSMSLFPRAEVCENPGRFISVVVDASGSNALSDPQHLRLGAAIDIINYLTTPAKATATNKADKVSVVSFTQSASVVYPLGDPSQQAISAVQRIGDNGGTAIYAGVQAGLKQINNAGAAVNGRGGIIVLTDGQDFSKRDLITTLATCKQQGVRVSLGYLNPNKNTGGILNWFSPNNVLDAGVSAAVLATGGSVATISDAAAQQAFVQIVIKNGLTNNDGKCGGLDVDESGGPVAPNITANGLCNNNAKATFTYSPTTGSEKLAFNVALISKSNPVVLTAVLTNTATGATSTVTVNSGNPSTVLNGVASAGQGVTLTVQPSGADNSQTCQYSVSLIVSADNGGGNTSAPPPATTSNPPVETSAPPPATTSNPPVETSAPPPATTSNPPAETSSAPPVDTTSAPPVVTSCAEPSVSTIISTIISTVTAPGPTVTAPAPTETNCLCKCGTPGSVPFPKLEL